MADPAAPAAAAGQQALNLRIRGFLFELRQLDDRLTLRATHREGYGPIWADFLDADQKRRIAGGRKQLLAKAVGLGKWSSLHVLDGTGGMGRDAFTLAALGADVTVVERTPVVVKLLECAQRRAALHPNLGAAAERLHVLQADTAALLQSAAEFGNQWDVIYLDPMYPEDGKSALPSKEMQILRDLTGGDADADALLALALPCARLRVVVKRPQKAPPLAGVEPSLSFGGSQARYDVYLSASMAKA